MTTRTDRVFCLDGRWHYQTREDDHGPFQSREAAERDLPDFADFSLIDKD